MKVSVDGQGNINWDDSAVLSNDTFSSYVRKDQWDSDSGGKTSTVDGIIEEVKSGLNDLAKKAVLDYAGAVEI